MPSVKQWVQDLVRNHNLDTPSQSFFEMFLFVLELGLFHIVPLASERLLLTYGKSGGWSVGGIELFIVGT